MAKPTLLVALSAVLAVLGFMMTVPPNVATSNLSKWLEYLGLPSFSAVLTPTIDSYVMWGCFILAAVLGAWAAHRRLLNFSNVVGRFVSRRQGRVKNVRRPLMLRRDYDAAKQAEQLIKTNFKTWEEWEKIDREKEGDQS